MCRVIQKLENKPGSKVLEEYTFPDTKEGMKVLEHLWRKWRKDGNFHIRAFTPVN